MRLIDADALKKRLFTYYTCVNEDTYKGNYDGQTLLTYEVADMIRDCLGDAPTITPESLIKHGYWLDFDGDGLSYQCSVCNLRTRDVHNYCPRCGAKMDMEID